MRDHLIRQFLIELRMELEVEGIDTAERGAIVSEAHSHLVDAFDVADPMNEAEERGVIDGFGAARTMAQSLAREYTYARSRRRYVWPALFVLAACVLFSLINSQLHLPLFGREIWVGTLYVAFCALWLVALGYKARRPLVSQFLVLAGGLLIGRVCWLMFTCYPVPNHFAEFVKRNEVAKDVAFSNRMIRQDRLVASELRFGQQFFSDPSKRPVPDFLTNSDGSYLLPDGIREAGHGLPARSGPSLTARFWNDAVREWNQRPYSIESEGVPGRKTAAEVWMIRSVRDIGEQENHIQTLYRSVKSPWWNRLEWTVQLQAPGVIAVSLAAALITNAGWVLRVLFAPIVRHTRRRRLATR